MTNFPKEPFEADAFKRGQTCPPSSSKRKPWDDDDLSRFSVFCFFFNLTVGWGHIQPSQVVERRLHGGSKGRRVRLLHLQRRGPDPHGRPQPLPLLRPAETLRHRHGQVWLQVSWSIFSSGLWLRCKRELRGFFLFFLMLKYLLAWYVSILGNTLLLFELNLFLNMWNSNIPHIWINIIGWLIYWLIKYINIKSMDVMRPLFWVTVRSI